MAGVVQVSEGTVGALGEFELVSQITARFPTAPDVLVGPGDDAAVVVTPDGRVVATTDLLIEGRHFRRDWSTAYDIGRKAAAQNLSDVVAMGAKPTALLVGFAAPPDLPSEWALQLADGLREECELAGATVVGGDVARHERVVVSVTALGDLEGRAPVLRSGARAGDLVAVAGRLGWAAAGLSVLSRGFRSPRALVDAHRRPEPPYEMGPAAVLAGATSMIDVSDGLLADLGHIARASGVSIDVDSGSLTVGAPLVDAAAAFGSDPLTWVLTGGDDHALAATFPPDADLPTGFQIIGRVATAGPVAILVDGHPYDGAAGFDHFR
jgi:thiamine-monophosphate kinase